MSINNDQLQIWANAPASSKAQYTYQQIKNALTQSGISEVRGCEIYLQGSYANSTNIRVDSDIDVVVQLNSTFSPGIHRLSDYQKTLFQQAYPTDATYNWPELRRDVISALVNYFEVPRIKTDGNKSIKLIGDLNLSNADIVPCLQYRNYNSFDLSNKEDYVEGMRFWTMRDNVQIINYPKVHKENGEKKNARLRTNEKYKDIVRIMKHIRKKMVEDENFESKKCPSYFIESAVYNVPDTHFHYNHQLSLENVFNFLLRTCDADKLTTVSHQHFLFGPEQWQWNRQDASEFLTWAESYYRRN